MKIIKTLFLTLILTFSTFACTETILIQGQVLQQIGQNTYIPIYQAKVQNDIYFGYSNPFGYYSFIVPNCGTRQFTATHKEYTFDPQTVVLPIPDTQDLTITFIANQ